MIFCIDCFKDQEIRAEIELIGHKGDCPICNKSNTWIYDSNTDNEYSNIEDMLSEIIDIYIPYSELPVDYPDNDVKSIYERLIDDWNIFSNNKNCVEEIVKWIVDNSFYLNDKVLHEPVGIPQLYDDEYLNCNSIMGIYSWDKFKKNLRNVNRFHSRFINLELFGDILKDTEIIIPAGKKYYRARVSNEKGEKGFTRKEMSAPPDDVASPGRANSKGQSCLYLCNKHITTVKEIRAHAFDYVTIATFKVKRNLRVLDLSSITHNSPFYSYTNKIDYLINEKILSAIQDDLAKPMSRWDSELDYLPTQYISDFAKYLGYDGVKYYSTFDKDSYNLALFDPSVCECIYHRNYLVDNLNYKIIPTKK